MESLKKNYQKIKETSNKIRNTSLYHDVITSDDAFALEWLQTVKDFEKFFEPPEPRSIFDTLDLMWDSEIEDVIFSLHQLTDREGTLMLLHSIKKDFIRLYQDWQLFLKEFSINFNEIKMALPDTFQSLMKRFELVHKNPKNLESFTFSTYDLIMKAL